MQERMITLLGLTFLLLILCTNKGSSVNLPDFQVSEEDYPGVFDQVGAAVAHDANGRYVVTWRDHRDETPYAYFQILSPLGQPIGSNQKVDAEPFMPFGMNEYPTPDVAMTAGGYFAIAYKAGSSFDASQVFVRIYDPNGLPVGGRIQVSSIGQSHRYIPEVAIGMNDAGEILVVFHSERVGDVSKNYWGQYLDLSGSLIGSNFIINQVDSLSLSTGSMRVAVSNQDRVFCTWQATYANPYNREMVMFSAFDFGTPASSPEVALDIGTGYSQIFEYEIAFPLLAHNFQNGLTCVGWNGSYHDSVWNWWEKFYVQMFDQNGTPTTGRTEILSDSTTGQSWGAQTISSIGDHFIAGFYEYWDTLFFIQEFGNDGEPIGSYITLHPDAPSGYIAQFGMFPLSANSLIFTWRDSQYYNSGDIFTQGLQLGGTPLFSIQRVSDDIGAPQNLPVVATDFMGNSLVLWLDQRDHGANLYGQVLSANGIPVGANFRVNDVLHGVRQVEIASNGYDRAVAVWSQRPDNGYGTVKAQIFQLPGFTPVGNDLTIYQGSWFFDSFWPDVGVAEDGSYVVTWRQRLGESNYVYNTYLRSFAADGTPLTPITKVNTSSGGYLCWGCEDLYFDYVPRIDMRSNGDYAIAWLEDTEPNPSFVRAAPFLQLYDKSSNPISGNIQVCEGFGVASISNEEIPPDIAVNGDGNYAVSWTGDSSFGPQGDCNGIWIRVFHPNGFPLGDGLKVATNDDNSFVYLTGRLLAGPDNNFLLTWYSTDDENQEIYTQKFNSSCIPVGTMTRINNDPSTHDQRYPAAAIAQNTAIIAWEDFRNARGNPDIFSRLVEWDKLSGLTGDLNMNGIVNIADVVYLINYIFNNGAPPEQSAIGDVNCSAVVNISDVVYLIAYIFSGGPAPCAAP